MRPAEMVVRIDLLVFKESIRAPDVFWFVILPA
jgi:hypothetical protein